MKKLILSIIAAGCLFGSTFGSEKPHVQYTDWKINPKLKHYNFEPLLEAATKIKPHSKEIKLTFLPEVVDMKQVLENNESAQPAGFITQTRSYLQKTTAKDIARAALTVGARMAGKYAIDFSNTLVHEYGHALAHKFFDGGKSHVFIGPDQYFKPSSDYIQRKINTEPYRFTISDGYPLNGATTPEKTTGALTMIAGPFCGMLHSALISALLRKCGASASSYSEIIKDVFLDASIGSLFPKTNLLIQSLTSSSLDSQAKARLVQNLMALYPARYSIATTDGYKFLQKIGVSVIVLNQIPNIIPQSILIAFGATAIKYCIDTWPSEIDHSWTWIK